MAAPPPPPRSWANLPADSLHEIFGRVPCAADRHRAYHACTAWLKAMAEAPKLPPALPWLLLPAPPEPDDGSGSTTTSVVCVLSGCRVHHRHHHPFLPPPGGARCFGSHDGAWLFLGTREPRRHLLLNVRTGAVLNLPGALDVDGTVILAATLSSSPDDPSCAAAAIIAATAPVPHHLRRRVAFWRMGRPRVHEMVPAPAVDPQAPYRTEDVVFHEGAFHFLLLGRRNQGERHTLVCTLNEQQEAEDIAVAEEFRGFLPDPDGRIYDQSVRSRYLVSSGGDLLLVLRFAPHPNEPTSKFKVFRAAERPQMPDRPDDHFPWAWIEMNTLGGRILVVGYGCSRSYEADRYAGIIKEGIYFLDDGKFYDELDIFQGDDNIWPYPCSDNGKWSEGRAQRCFPATDPSIHSPPAWLLP